MTTTTDDRPTCFHRWNRHDHATERCTRCGATRTAGDRIEQMLRTVRRDGTDAQTAIARRAARQRRR